MKHSKNSKILSMNHINEKTSMICYRTGYIACVKTNRYIMSLGIGKTLYQTGMVFNTRACTGIDTLVYPYIPAQHGLEK
jgi:hypothetical protein